MTPANKDFLARWGKRFGDSLPLRSAVDFGLPGKVVNRHYDTKAAFFAARTAAEQFDISEFIDLIAERQLRGTQLVENLASTVQRKDTAVAVKEREHAD